MGRILPKTKEEKVAIKMSDLVNDYNLDLNEVGKYFAKVSGLVSYNRFQEVLEIAQTERENENVRNSHNPLF
jgi:hypothetical protein